MFTFVFVILVLLVLSILCSHLVFVIGIVGVEHFVFLFVFVIGIVGVEDVITHLHRTGQPHPQEPKTTYSVYSTIPKTEKEN